MYFLKPIIAYTAAEAAEEQLPNDLVLPANIFRLIVAAVLIALAVLAFWLLKKAFKKYRDKESDINRSRRTWMMILYSLLRFGIAVVLVLLLLDLYGVNISGAIAGLGIAGAAGALAVQDLLKDTIMGITIITDKYFSVDDVIQYKDEFGIVTEMSMRCTKYRSLEDGSINTVSNHLFTEIRVIERMRIMNVPMSYDLKTEETDAFFERVGERLRDSDLITEYHYRGANGFEDSFVKHLVVYYCDPVNLYKAKRELFRAIMLEMEATGYKVPYPQLDIHEDKA